MPELAKDFNIPCRVLQDITSSCSALDGLCRQRTVVASIRALLACGDVANTHGSLMYFSTHKYVNIFDAVFIIVCVFLTYQIHTL